MWAEYGHFEEDQLDKAHDVRLMRRLLPYLKRYRLLLAGSILLVVLITLIDLAIPYITKIAIDDYILPTGRTEKALSIPADREETRVYSVALDRPENRRIIEKYAPLFTVRRDVAEIRPEDFKHIDQTDLLVLRQADAKGVAGMALILFLVIVIHFGLNFAQTMIMEYTGQRVMHDLRGRLFRHIQSLSMTFFTRQPVGRLVTRSTSDVQNMHEMFTSVLTFIFQDLFLLAGISIVMLSVNWKLTLVCFTVLPFVVAAAFYFSGSAREAFRMLRTKIAEINSRFAEMIGGIRVLQLFRQEQRNFDRFRKVNHDHYLAGMQQIQVFAVFMPVIELLGSLSVAIVIYYGGIHVLSQGLSLGELVAFITYMRMFFRPIRDIAEKYNIMQNAMASAERIFQIMDTRAHLDPPAFAPEQGQAGSDLREMERIQRVEFQHIGFAYKKEEPVLDDLSFELKAGETIAFVGPTGAGKTSIINLILRYYHPDRGRILINGEDIGRYTPASLRSRIALVTQEPFLFTGSIRDNIVFSEEGKGTMNLEEILRISNCHRLLEKLPDGIDTILSEGGSSLSSGEKQLVAIARAVAVDPDLIILDEATSYIDSMTEELIQQAVFNLMTRRTCLIVAHRLSTARKAGRIFVLKQGRVIETGSHDQLMARKGFYYRLNLLRG